MNCGGGGDVISCHLKDYTYRTGVLVGKRRVYNKTGENEAFLCIHEEQISDNLSLSCSTTIK